MLKNIFFYLLDWQTRGPLENWTVPSSLSLEENLAVGASIGLSASHLCGVLLEAAVEDGPSSSSLEAPYSQQHQQCSSEDPAAGAAAAATAVEAPFAVEAEAANSKKKSCRLFLKLCS